AAHRRRLERGLAVLYINLKSNALATMLGNQCVAIADQLAREAREGQVLDALAALLLERDELLVHGAEVGAFGVFAFGHQAWRDPGLFVVVLVFFDRDDLTLTTAVVVRRDRRSGGRAHGHRGWRRLLWFAHRRDRGNRAQRWWRVARARDGHRGRQSTGLLAG